MSTSDTNTPSADPSAEARAVARLRAKRTAIVGLSLALFCIVFTIIYERFSHNAASPQMRCMFLMPLCGVALPSVLGYVIPFRHSVSRLTFNLWNSAMAVWTVGCLFRGIVNISGRHTTLDRPYWIAGWIFVALAVISEITCLISLTHQKSHTL